MPKIRKTARRKRFNHNKNRKRMKKHDQLPKVENKTISKLWNKKSSTVKNLKRLGLAIDLNKDIKMDTDDSSIAESKTRSKVTPALQQLEKEANAPRAKGYRLPVGQVELITYLLDTYGEDYKAMVKDKRNHAQLTWKQMRAKINSFKKIPEQYNVFLEGRKGKEVDTTKTEMVVDDEDLF